MSKFNKRRINKVKKSNDTPKNYHKRLLGKNIPVTSKKRYPKLPFNILKYYLDQVKQVNDNSPYNFKNITFPDDDNIQYYVKYKNRLTNGQLSGIKSVHKLKSIRHATSKVGKLPSADNIVVMSGGNMNKIKLKNFTKRLDLGHKRSVYYRVR
ncbi:MAG: hypothetical protein H8D94_01420 [Candidatus Pelagibacter sp.]|nr:hypothetical protein [Candidatus Pelagibacter sp.]